MEIKIASEEEIKYCYTLMHQIREDLSEKDFLLMITEQIKNGYQIVYVTENNQIICVVGFNILNKLSWGKYLYIEDFVTDKSTQYFGAAKALFDFIKIYGKQQKCTSIHLDSSVSRQEAHKFYLSQNMQMDSHHFSIKI